MAIALTSFFRGDQERREAMLTKAGERMEMERARHLTPHFPTTKRTE